MAFLNERVFEIALFTFMFTVVASGLLTLDAAANPTDRFFEGIDINGIDLITDFANNKAAQINTDSTLEGGIAGDGGEVSGSIISDAVSWIVPDVIESAANWTQNVLTILIVFIANILDAGKIITSPFQIIFNVLGVGDFGAIVVSFMRAAVSIMINLLNMRFFVALWRGV